MQNFNSIIHVFGRLIQELYRPGGDTIAVRRSEIGWKGLLNHHI